jgi:hypothetical protein
MHCLMPIEPGTVAGDGKTKTAPTARRIVAA